MQEKRPFGGPSKPELNFAFRITIYMGERHRFGAGPSGTTRGFTSVAHGLIEGPRLSGKVLAASGGDYPGQDRDLFSFSICRIGERDSGPTPAALRRAKAHPKSPL